MRVSQTRPTVYMEGQVEYLRCVLRCTGGQARVEYHIALHYLQVLISAGVKCKHKTQAVNINVKVCLA